MPRVEPPDQSPHKFTPTTAGPFVDDGTIDGKKVLKNILTNLFTMGTAGWIKGPMGRSIPDQHKDIKSTFMKNLAPAFIVSGAMCAVRGRGRIFRSLRFLTISCTGIATLHCGAVLRCNPAPINRETMLSHLPGDPRAKPSAIPTDHPLFPFTETTRLIPYISDKVFAVQTEFEASGNTCGLRTILLRVDENSRDVLVYSPIYLLDEIRADLETFNLNVKYIVAPNSAHHLFVPQWAEAFPEAKIVAPPVLAQKRKDISFDYELLSNDDHVPWDREQIDFRVVPMSIGCEEIVLYHRSSKTMVISDLAQNVGHTPEIEDCTVNSKLIWGTYGMTARPGVAGYLKLIGSDKPELFKKVIWDIKDNWDFERVTLSHGRLIEVNAKKCFDDIFGFMEGEEYDLLI